MMQNRLKDRDRGGYTSDRYRPHDNYTNAFNMLAQIGLAEKEVTNSMRNAVTQAANVKALQDRLKFDVSSYSAKLNQSALDYSTGLQMKYENLIQTYMDDNEDKRKEEIRQWAEKNKNNDEYKDNVEGFKEAFKKKRKEVYETDKKTAEKKYEAISDIIKSHSDATQQHIKEFDNVFSLHPNNSNVSDNNNSDVSDNNNSVKKTNAIIEKFFEKFFKNFFTKEMNDE